MGKYRGQKVKKSMIKRRNPCHSCGHVLPSLPPALLLLRWGTTPDGDPEDWEYMRKRCKTSLRKDPGDVIVRDIQNASLTRDGELVFDETANYFKPSIDVLAGALRDIKAGRDKDEPLLYKEVAPGAKSKSSKKNAREKCRERGAPTDAELSSSDQAGPSSARSQCNCPVPDGYRRLLVVSLESLSSFT